MNIKGCKFLIIILYFNYTVQEILNTYKNIVIEVLLMPGQTNGKFEINVDKNVVFDGKA